MTDPVTIGTLAATALSMAADAALKGVVGEGVKDAYIALKEKVARWAGGDVEALEKAPASANRQALIAQAVDGQATDEQVMVKTLVAVLVAALNSRTGGPVGLDIGRLNALSVQLDAITVTEGTGVIIDEVNTPGEFRAGPINIGTSLGKTGQ
jgi:hypothetical protein